MTTINRQQKSVLPQRTFVRCATQPAPTSGDIFAFPFLIRPPEALRVGFFYMVSPSRAMPGSRACRLTYHMCQNYEPRTHRDRSALALSHSHSHKIAQTKCPFNFFFSPILLFLFLSRTLFLSSAFSRDSSVHSHSFFSLAI